MRVTVEQVTSTTLKKKSRKKRKSKSDGSGKEAATAAGSASGSGSGSEASNEYSIEQHVETIENLYDHLSDEQSVSSDVGGVDLVQSNHGHYQHHRQQSGNQTVPPLHSSSPVNVTYNFKLNSSSPKMPTSKAFKFKQIKPIEKKSLNERILNEMEKNNVTHRLYYDEREYATATAAAHEDIFQQRGEELMRYGRGGAKMQDDNDDDDYDEPTAASLDVLIADNYYVHPKHKQEEQQRPAEFIDDNWLMQIQDEWQKFNAFLKKILDEYTLRDATLFLQELVRLQTYLNSEYETSKTENELYFFDQAQIVEHLNTTINGKLLRLSQSSDFFERTKQKLFHLLESKLSRFNLNECLSKFDKFQLSYFYLFSTIKAKLKLKMSKFENYVKIWNDFESDCVILDEIFNDIEESENVKCNLLYRSKQIEITKHLNRLKDALSTLTSVCNEAKYFELKNEIISYEIKLKNFKRENGLEHEYAERYVEQENKENSLHHQHHYQQQHHNHHLLKRNLKTVRNNEMNASYTAGGGRAADFLDENNVQIKLNRSFNYPTSGDTRRYTATNVTPIKITREPYGNKNLNNNNDDSSNVSPSVIEIKRHRRLLSNDFIPKKVITSDKSTATINDNSTQTEPLEVDVVQRSQIVNVTQLSDKLNYNDEHDHLPHHRSIDRLCSNKNDTSHRETEGKKLLLEAYLRNNGGNNSSSSSSAVRTDKKREANNADAGKNSETATRESGIATANDDEVDSSQSAAHYEHYVEEFDVDFSCKNSSKQLSDENNNNMTSQTSTNKQKKKLKQKQQRNSSSKQSAVIDEEAAASTGLKLKSTNNHQMNAKLNKMLTPLSNVSSSSCSTSIADNQKLFKSTNAKTSVVTATAVCRRMPPLPPAQPPSPSAPTTLPSPTPQSKTTKKEKTYLQKFLQLLFLFLIPLLFLLFVYFIYIYFLSPSCCDFKRNYLFINVS